MAPYVDDDEEVFGTSNNSKFLSPHSPSSKKSPSRSGFLKPRQSTSPLAPLDMDEGDTSNGRPGAHSLAHELAVALMPEPSAGSRLLAEEFGIEYDEGAEGIDEDGGIAPQSEDVSFEDQSSMYGQESLAHHLNEGHADYGDPTFASPISPKRAKRPERDAMETLAQDLESTDTFLSHLRGIDLDSTTSLSSTTPSQPTLERIASDVIRRINDTTRDRESQVRALLEYEREFRKIAGEVGGTEVLGQLDELEGVEQLTATTPTPAPSRELHTLEEEDTFPTHSSHDWELDPDHQHLGDHDDEQDFDDPAESPSHTKDTFEPPPPISNAPTAAETIPQLAHLRSFTTSLVSSLTTISEQAQVNGAATTEAGRKIRALKNKIGGWRTEWEGAEKSRVRIERWEAGLVDGDGAVNGHENGSPVRMSIGGRVDGRQFVQEHLSAFEKALVEAGVRTQAIMAVT